MVNYLIVYDREKATQISLREFEDDVEAVKAYDAAEMQHLERPHIDIVLVGADSIDTIKVTHASYFVEGHHSVEYLIGALLNDLDRRGALSAHGAV